MLMMAARMASMFFMRFILRVQKQCQGVNIDPCNLATRLDLATWLDPWQSTWKLDQDRAWQLDSCQALTRQINLEIDQENPCHTPLKEGASLAP
jgi:hypothetical protein